MAGDHAERSCSIVGSSDVGGAAGLALLRTPSAIVGCWGERSFFIAGANDVGRFGARASHPMGLSGLFMHSANGHICVVPFRAFQANIGPDTPGKIYPLEICAFSDGIVCSAACSQSGGLACLHLGVTGGDGSSASTRARNFGIWLLRTAFQYSDSIFTVSSGPLPHNLGTM